jgi:hypothetical protein
MATTATLAAGARQLLRDFPRYFEINEGPLTVLTIRLPHPLVSGGSLQVYTVTNTDPPVSTPTTDWELDERNGLLKMTKDTYLGQTIVVAGYHYTWFTDSDLAHVTSTVVGEMLYGQGDDVVGDLSDVEAEVTQMGIVVQSLWSLSIELALDIDVSTPEGMFIPAHQRYQQVLQMMQYWEQEYMSRAASLNMGLGALQQFKLRRVSATTGRYVPVYMDREFDDPRWPKRLYPAIPEGQTDEPPVWAVIQETSEVTQGHYPAATFPYVLGTGGRSSPRE